MEKILWSERIKRPPKPLTFETYLREQDNPISSHPEARDPRIIPLVTSITGVPRPSMQNLHPL